MQPLLIGGEWCATTQALPNVNPSDTADIVAEVAQGGRHEADLAIAAARDVAPGWAAAGPLARHDVLRRAAEEMMARREELGRELSREEGKPIRDGVAEATRAAHIFGFFASEALRLTGETGNSVRPGIEVAVTREPVGVVGLITPWNFPLAIPAWKLAPALAYGNAVVLKPAELAPTSAWAIVDILNRAGAPAGVVNLVTGPGGTVGQALVDNPDVDAISFTGSVATGRRVAEGCARTMRRVQLEMGGKNPLVVLDDAELDTAVACAVEGAFGQTGQRCTASSRLVVTEGIHGRFVEACADRLRRMRVGHALDPATDIGPVVDERQLAQDERYIEIARREGATLRHGGGRERAATPGHYLQPALFTGTTKDMRLNREEVFGPVAGVIRVRDYDEALAVANDTEFGLCAGICTTSLKHATHFRRNSAAGMVMVNLPTAGVDFHVPFGGRKGSSLGPREQGAYAREFYTVVKTAYVSS